MVYRSAKGETNTLDFRERAASASFRDIITSVFQTILNMVEFDMGIQQAVAAKKFHHQWLPDEVYMEEGALDAAVFDRLKAKGYHVKSTGNIGRVDAIMKTKWGYYQGGADPRGDDLFLGW